MVKLGRTMQFLLHLDSPEINFSRAKQMRRAMTGTEAILGSHLRNRQVSGCKFRRQHPIGHYIADFYCHEKRLIIEVDGAIHGRDDITGYDANRSAEMERYGISIVRFRNSEIEENLDEVIKTIQSALASLPSP